MVFAFGNHSKSKSVILIDVGASSVAGAYVRYANNDIPTVIYTRRLPVEQKNDEQIEAAMLRALKVLGTALVTEGAPILARTSGSGTAGSILISIDAPWQQTSIRTEHLEEEAPFIFTKSIANKALEKSAISSPKKLLVDESIIGTLLNGYRTRNPYGKSAHRADILILTSLIDEYVVNGVVSAVQGIFHSRDTISIGGGSLRYQTIQKVFPHERDSLVIDATGPDTSIAISRNGLFSAIVEVTETANGDSWNECVRSALSELSKQYPLPRTIFLLSDEPESSESKNTLSGAVLDKLWLSENPPKVVAVQPSHLVRLVRQTTTARPDLPLLLMALYYAYRAADAAV